MTQEQIRQAIRTSSEEMVRIVQGEGADRDFGNAWLDDDGSIVVGWDSGQRTKLYGDDAEIVE